MSNRIPFQKPYASAHDLVRLLQSRGLTVADTAKAERYLEFIGYYRVGLHVSPPTDAQGAAQLQTEHHVRPSDDALPLRQEIAPAHLQRD